MFAETLQLERVRNPQEARRALDIIGRETRRLGQLVDNVLYFHRHRRAPVTGAFEPVELAAFVQEVADSFTPLVAARRMSIVCEDDPTAVTVRADPQLLRQILLNLFDNAAKFGPPGQTIRGLGRTVGPPAPIAIEDEGPGVAAPDRERIWRPFERAAGASAAGGAGIGLSIVRTLVDAHDGSVAVESAGAGGGARFIVRLPEAWRAADTAARVG
jgi:signal transduction histidine kinase